MIELQTVWGLQPALYLCLGGMGGGAFVMAALLVFVDKPNSERTVAVSMWAAVICLVAGLLCLLTELTNPLRGLLLWQSFSNYSSWMTFGAWMVFAAVVVFGLAAVVATDATAALVGRAWKGFSSRRAGLLKALSGLGLVLGACVAMYTGVLLMSAPGVPLWNTFLLPCLFTVSAFDTGIALVEIVLAVQAKRERLSRKAHTLMNVLVVVLVVVELVVLTALLLTMSGGNGAAEGSGVAAAAMQSAALVVSGQLAPFFWVLVVACGLLLPLLMAIAGLMAKPKGPNVAADAKAAPDAVVVESVPAHPLPAEKASKASIIGATGALVGGCALRFLVIMAGIHADVVADATAQIFADMLARLG